MTYRSTLLTAKERRWNWRTWNLLVQIREATDGVSPFQRSGEVVVGGLYCPSLDPQIMGLADRRWIETHEVAELLDSNGRVLPVWTITSKGRCALDAAEREGIQVR